MFISSSQFQVFGKAEYWNESKSCFKFSRSLMSKVGCGPSRKWAWTNRGAVQFSQPYRFLFFRRRPHACGVSLCLSLFRVSQSGEDLIDVLAWQSWAKLQRTRGFSNLFALCIFFVCLFDLFLLVLVRRVCVAGYLLPEGEGGGLACAECFQTSPDRRGIQHLWRWPKTSPCYPILQVAICETLFIR